MAERRHRESKKPKEERSRIGTPAGESPAEGRKRHGTRCLTEDCAMQDEVKYRNVVEGEEDFEDEENEISTTGGVTGTKVAGSISPGVHTRG